MPSPYTKRGRDEISAVRAHRRKVRREKAARERLAAESFKVRDVEVTTRSTKADLVVGSRF